MEPLREYDVPIPWNQIRAWVEGHERNQTPLMGLSKTQIAALSCLVSFMEEPELDEANYVSQLIETCQTQKRQVPLFKDLEPVEVPVDGAFQLRWRCICSIPWCNATLPCEGFGYGPREQAPLFSSKKKAKQFAAREALRFLTENPQTSVVLTTPQSRRPNPASFPPTPPTPAPTAKKRPLPSSNESSRATSGTSSPAPLQRTDSDSSAAIYARVASLASNLGVGVPTYRVDEDPLRQNFFNGRPIFFSGVAVPTGLGVVTGVLGKKQAKLQIAERVLVWMEHEYMRRTAAVEAAFT